MPTMTKAGYTPPAEPKKKPPKKTSAAKKKRRKTSGMSPAVIASLAVFLVACAIGVGTIFIYTTTAPYANAFLPGTMLLGYPLGGATMQDAQALLDKITAEDLASFEVELSWDKQSYVLSASDLSLAVDAGATLDALWQRGHEGGMLSCFMEMLRLRQEPMIAQPIVTYDMAVADELLALVEQDIACEAEDAQAAFTPGSAQPFAFTPETVGYRLDLSDVRAQIERAAASVEAAVIALSPEAILPKVTLEDLQEATVLRSRVRMEIDAQEAAYANVALAAKAIDGAVIKPGETFSFNKTVGARTAARGYVPAAEPAYGVDVSGVGGGVCQLASALYRAALLSGLNVSEHSAAVYPVPYGEMAQEAAVSDQGIDLAFENTTAYPLYLRARVYQEDKAAYLDVQLIGEALKGRYALETVILEETLIEEPVYVRDHEGKYAKYDDERVAAGEAKPGYTAVLERVTLDGEGEETAREQIAKETYAAIPPAIYVGIQSR